MNHFVNDDVRVIEASVRYVRVRVEPEIIWFDSDDAPVLHSPRVGGGPH